MYYTVEEHHLLLRLPTHGFPYVGLPKPDVNVGTDKSATNMPWYPMNIPPFGVKELKFIGFVAVCPSMVFPAPDMLPH